MKKLINGDEIVCIKNYYFDFSDLLSGSHREDVSYTAWKKYKFIFFGETSMGPKVNYVLILDDRGKRHGFYYEIESEQISPIEPALYEYFIHPTELRRKKLKKLNE